MDAISDATLDIWVIQLDQVVITEEILRNLSRDEKMRARSVPERTDRRRYIVSHYILRKILAGYTRYSPGALKLRRSSNGKPHLTDNSSNLRFNFSRVGDTALIGVAKDADVGVDLVAIKPVSDMDTQARMNFTLMEYSLWKNLSPVEQLTAFHNGWARKQAYMKALEDNGGRSCQSFSVPLADYETPTWLPIKRNYTDRLWSLYAFRPAPGFTAAAVAEGHIQQLRMRRYDPQPQQVNS